MEVWAYLFIKSNLDHKQLLRKCWQDDEKEGEKSEGKRQKETGK